MDPFTPKAGYGQNISNSVLGIPRVIRLDEHRVLKKARNVLEPDIMKFITANTTIPVPKTYETKFDEEQKTFYIIMDYMHGKPLDKAWVNLTQDQRASTCRQIAGYLKELRQLTGKQIEGVNGTPVRTPSNNPGHHHAIHFAHGDLSPRNILVDEGGHITAVLDWEWAGWFPEYWDVVRMLTDIPSKKQMPEYAKHLHSVPLYQYEREYFAMVHVLRLEPPDPRWKTIHPATSSN
ncbi:hypothetical protein EMCG_01881 [[Emmonsia] crescens]|uniref:Aminoglycoside phosphotransferase domain-containing protein n=1 Tax=[Emmonsia] crescens TaxID=73230 RepID=A0A0G2HZK9_9EURO|nr:hypothetical protein EMCG_01881 [Emmonsia crescens UAMH 3008]